MTKHDAARKQRIIEYIATTTRQRGYPPSVREIAQAVDLASTSAVHHHLQALEREGMLERGASASRALRLTPGASIRAGSNGAVTAPVASLNSHTLPVIGEIAAGGPIEAYQDASETLAVPDALSNGDAYVLKVRGDSMIDDHICDGDFVVVESTAEAANGETVVALVDDSDATLKRFYNEKNGKIRLQPSNPTVTPMIYEAQRVKIQGRVIGVLRRF